jgi:hypothetical protein
MTPTNCIRCFEFFKILNNNYRLYSILNLNDLIKKVSQKKFKTSEPFGSALWPNLLRYRTFAIVHYGCMSDALQIQPQGACNF